MAQTSYEEYLKAILGDAQAPQAPQAPMAMPDISNIQQALQGVQNVNQSYVAPQLTDLGMFRKNFEEGRRQTAEDLLAQSLGVAPAGGMFSGDSDGSTLGLTPEQMAYFDIETPAERDARMGSFAKTITPGWIQAVLGLGAPVLSGQTNYNIRSEEVKQALAREKVAYDNAMKSSGISWDSSAYGGSGGFVNSEGNAPGASPGEVGNVSFSGEVGYDQ